MLYIVATPIGNLKDITLRALEVLQSVDGVICEDTRRSKILLDHYQIKKPLSVLNNFNEAGKVAEYLNLLKSGQNLALISDAGTPLINDPGFKLVRECVLQGIEVDALPGASAVITALTLSTLPPFPFTYLGYLPEKEQARQSLLKKCLENPLPSTYIAYVAPHKLFRALEDIQTVLGDIDVVLANELTKVHQSVSKKAVSSWIMAFTSKPPKGEFTLLFNLKR